MKFSEDGNGKDEVKDRVMQEGKIRGTPKALEECMCRVFKKFI